MRMGGYNNVQFLFPECMVGSISPHSYMHKIKMELEVGFYVFPKHGKGSNLEHEVTSKRSKDFV